MVTSRGFMLNSVKTQDFGHIYMYKRSQTRYEAVGSSTGAT